MANRHHFVSFAKAGGVCVLFFVTPAQAKNESAPRPVLFQKLIDCRTIADGTARLACYDAQVASLDEAESRNEVVVLDKAQAKKAHKGLFGLNLPDLGLFGGSKAGQPVEQLDEIESVIRSASTNANGKWVLIIEDGAKWVQADTDSPRTPKAGMPIRIRRAALGSFFANIAGRPAIRVRREN